MRHQTINADILETSQFLAKLSNVFISHAQAAHAGVYFHMNVGNNAPAEFPKGTTTVIWTAVDASGNTDTATYSNIHLNQPIDMKPYTITCKGKCS